MGKLYVITMSLLVSIGAFITGYSAGSVNGLESFSGFLETFGLDSPDINNTVSSLNGTDDCSNELSDEATAILGAMVSIQNVGGLIGNLFGGVVADRVGRKVTIVISGAVMVLGGSIQTASFAAWMFIVGRVIAGLGYGLLYASGPVYLAELSPKDIRGACTSFIGPGLALGALLGNISNIGFSTTDIGWRLSRVLECVLSSIFIIAASYLPRSPRWLMLKDREPEAREVLRKTEPSDKIDTEIQQIKASLHSTNTSFVQAIRLMLKWNNFNRVLLGMTLHVFTATTGIAILFYSSDLFCSVGVPPFISTTVNGVFIFSGSICGTLFVDKFGRKTLLVYGALLLTVLGSAAATLVYIEDGESGAIGYVIVCLVCIFSVVFFATLHTVPWVVTSEIFPLEIRLAAAALATSMDWLALYIYIQLFPLARSYLNNYGVLYVMAGTDFLAFIFYLLCLPESKGVSLEEMEELFDKPWLERVNPLYYLRFGPLWPKRVKTKAVESSAPEQESNLDEDSSTVAEQKSIAIINNLNYEHHQDESHVHLEKAFEY